MWAEWAIYIGRRRWLDVGSLGVGAFAMAGFASCTWEEMTRLPELFGVSEGRR